MLGCFPSIHEVPGSIPPTLHKPGVEAGSSETQGHPQLYNEFESSLGHMRPFLKKKKFFKNKECFKMQMRKLMYV